MKSSLLALLLFNLVYASLRTSSLIVAGIKFCSEEEGGGVCPDNSKCCRIEVNHSNDNLKADEGVTAKVSSSGCLPMNRHIEGPGTCCGDTTSFGGTACAGNYQCAFVNSENSGDHGADDQICELSDASGNMIEQMPRYNLIEASSEDLGHFVVVDPPFISIDVWKKYAITVKLLLKNDPLGEAGEKGIVLAATVAENKGILNEMFGVQPTTFKPVCPNLIYQFQMYTNCPEHCTLLNKPNSEVPDD